jgi:hypothetical protein
MSKFDAGQGNGSTPKGLEASHHRGASAFDRSMIPGKAPAVADFATTGA